MPRKTTITAAHIDRRSPSPSLGLLETDVDSNVTLSTGNVGSDGASGRHRSGLGSGGRALANVASSPVDGKKSRSLLNLDNGRLSLLSSSASSPQKAALGEPPAAMKAAGGSPHRGCNDYDYRAKSMEFLLDKENQVAVKVRATATVPTHSSLTRLRASYYSSSSSSAARSPLVVSPMPAQSVRCTRTA